MKTLAVAIVLAVTAMGIAAPSRGCTGSASCRVCKNCRYCKHCAKEGGTCGVCKKRQPVTKKPKKQPKGRNKS
jgi:hypothetical protein